MPVLKRALPLLTLALAAAFGSAQSASFTLSGSPAPHTYGLEVNGLSRDGATSFVTGYDDLTGDQVSYLWTVENGFLAMTNPPVNSSFQNLSGDGHAALGRAGSWAATWKMGHAPVEIDRPVGASSSIATSSSYDASVIGGYFYVGGSQKPFRWTQGTGSVALDQGSAMYSGVYAVSDDGSTLVGYVTPNGQDNTVCRWNASGVRTDLSLPGAFTGNSADPVAVSADGTVTLLRVNTAAGQRAFLWESNGARSLGYVPGLVGDLQPMAISADGSVAVGSNFLPNNGGARAFIWDKVHGMRDLRAVLEAAGLGPDMGSADLVFARGVTVLPSGAIVVTGTASLPNGSEAFSATIPAEATFDGLGDFPGGQTSSSAAAISVDGETVVGNGQVAGGFRAFVWTATRGLTDLGAGAPYAAGVSRDGTTVVGGGAIGTGYRWREDGSGRWLGTGAEATAVSADGHVTVGSAVGPDGVTHAYRWNEGTTERYTTYIGTHVAPSRAIAASEDGSVFVGSTLPHEDGGVEYRERAFRWDDQGHQAALGDLPGGDVASEARGVSADGSVIVGWSSAASGEEAFRWTAANGMRSLGTIPGGVDARALAVSPDGTVIVGQYHHAGVARAFVWDANHGMRDLRDLVVAQGGVQAQSWDLLSASGVTVDASGRVYVAGSGRNGNGEYEAYRAVLPAQTYGPRV